MNHKHAPAHAINRHLHFVDLTWFCLSSLLLSGFLFPANAGAEIDHIQGEIVGEVTTSSAILQSRLTQSTTNGKGDVIGVAGFARFEFSESPNFETSATTEWLEAKDDNDFIVKVKISQLTPNTLYYYRLCFGTSKEATSLGPIRTFKTNPSPDSESPVNFVVVTGMNYYFFHYGDYKPERAYAGADKALGYPALESIRKLHPDFFIGTGDNVYFDHPGTRQFQRAKESGKNPLPGLHDGKQVETEAGMRHKYHAQFVQPRFVQLFSNTPTYWEKDDHDYRFNDSWPSMEFPISHELGIKNFKEQLPVTDPKDPIGRTYRTHRIGKLLQLWFTENRDYRSANPDPDGPGKTIWGKTQKEWLKQTLAESDATFKLLISPTPMVGPDGKGKKDNHTNLNGFRHEGNEFFNWAKQQKLQEKGFYIVCGDRHWQYHAIHPSGFEEFSCGALVDANSRLGVAPGSKAGTDPDGLIQQPYTSREPSGGFLQVVIKPAKNDSSGAMLSFNYYDENAKLLHVVTKEERP
jgi:alkaline phosphatase/alkaline phosphatase D